MTQHQAIYQLVGQNYAVCSAISILVYYNFTILISELLHHPAMGKLLQDAECSKILHMV